MTIQRDPTYPELMRDMHKNKKQIIMNLANGCPNSEVRNHLYSAVSALETEIKRLDALAEARKRAVESV